MVPFRGSYLESYQGSPKRNYHGAYGESTVLGGCWLRDVGFRVGCGRLTAEACNRLVKVRRKPQFYTE